MAGLGVVVLVVTLGLLATTIARPARAAHARRARRTPTAIGQKSLAATRWMVLRMRVAWTTDRSSSARFRSSRWKPASRDHNPTYPDGAYCVWRPPT